MQQHGGLANVEPSKVLTALFATASPIHVVQGKNFSRYSVAKKD